VLFLAFNFAAENPAFFCPLFTFMASGLNYLCGLTPRSRDGVPDEKKVRVPELSERLREFGECEVPPTSKPLVVLSQDSELRKKEIPSRIQELIRRQWPEFFGDLPKEVVSPPVCPEAVLVEDEGLQSSDEEDIPDDEEEIIDERMAEDPDEEYSDVGEN